MTRARLASLAIALPLVACSGGSQDLLTASSSPVASLQVVGTTLVPGQVVKRNEPIDIRFDQPIEPLSLSANTVRVEWANAAGSPAPPGADWPAVPGSLSLITPRVVRFQPRCPLLPDRSDAGFLSGVKYRLVIPTGGITGLISGGLANEYREEFRAASGTGSALWDDPVAGPPQARVRAQGSNSAAGSYMEVGGDPLARVYFEQDASGAIALEAGSLIPLNRYSLPQESVSFVVVFDQPIDPALDNLARVQLQYEESAGQWTELPFEASLEANCEEGGAQLNLAAVGVLPQGAAVRVFLDAGLADLVGEALTQPAPALGGEVRVATDPGTLAPGDTGDAWLESFVISGPDSIEDPDLPLDVQPAAWGNGVLAATSEFSGTGGPGGDFDWVVGPGETFLFDTTFTTLVGGPNGVPVTTLNVVNGVLDVDDVRIARGGRVVVIGPNPLQIIATGEVIIEGTVSLDGAGNNGVATLNNTSQPEPGSVGNGGGGRGGTGSANTSRSTPAGLPGFGAFNTPGMGGGGGEAGYSASGVHSRRAAGGGGGALAADTLYRFGGTLVEAQALIGLDAEPGFAGGANGQGALSAPGRAMGGDVGPSPFVDGNAGNDFVGLQRDLAGNLIVGELAEATAGTGGGGGGDASSTSSWPMTPFNPTGDEKGAGGGGGAGGLQVLAQGRIVVGFDGRISADGGHGGGGENTSFFNRVGGGSGGGSGGHIVLESLTQILVLGEAASAGPFYGDDPSLIQHDARPLSALGGQGGAGNNDRGGANATGPSPWVCDAIPLDRVAPLMVPPFNSNCFMGQPNFNDPEGPTNGAGGDGGPGLIQLNVPDPASQLEFATTIDPTAACAPPPVGWVDGMFESFGVPSISNSSTGQSRWIDLGLARVDPGGGVDQVEFFLRGLDADGYVSVNPNGQVDPGAPLIAAAPVGSAPSVPALGATSNTMVLDTAQVTGFDDVYLRNTALLSGSSLRLIESPNGAVTDLEVQLAEYDASAGELTVHVLTPGTTLASLITANTEAGLWTPSLRISSGGSVGTLSSGSRVRLRLDATVRDADGQPDPAASFSAQTGDWASMASELNAADWDFFRFRVDFELGFPQATGPEVEFLSVPFRF